MRCKDCVHLKQIIISNLSAHQCNSKELNSYERNHGWWNNGHVDMHGAEIDCPGFKPREIEEE